MLDAIALLIYLLMGLFLRVIWISSQQMLKGRRILSYKDKILVIIVLVIIFAFSSYVIPSFSIFS
ncbi:unnamed protein product [Phytomonas sp. Hart1]|nr:unnamed protein product [Phytomonas sp. Hart1]|eukprot:CCW72116.1 unnamed protein product [Phytomonas sp. isolate Hart1]